uniref:Uncharacterized protein n=1 Tax=Anguilla anguilla TaxID=7936 RepID=A0A0E9TKA1_ANGAN
MEFSTGHAADLEIFWKTLWSDQTKAGCSGLRVKHYV